MDWGIAGETVLVMQILDPATVTGAEYFNWFFTLVMVFGLIAFGLNVMVRLIARS
jgi:hypothetical protein